MPSNMFCKPGKKFLDHKEVRVIHSVYSNDLGYEMLFVIVPSLYEIRFRIVNMKIRLDSTICLKPFAKEIW